jgi:GNAT superfamily N-acetyltransferase
VTGGAPVVRPAEAGDVAAMHAVSAAAGRRFAEVDDPRIAERAGDPPLAAEALAAWVAAGRAWVAVDAGVVTGFLVADVVDGDAHVEEVSVDPAAHGRGLGTALLAAVAEAAAGWGSGAVTLTTFRDVAWNLPFYERRGYVVLGPGEIGPELAARLRDEAAAGLDPALRVCMRRPPPA